MKRILALSALALAGLCARADNITNQGRVYVDITVVSNRSNAAGLAFTHKSGAGRIDFADMSGADRIKYGYNEEAYLAFKENERRKEQAAADAPPPADAPAVLPSNGFRIVRTVTVITNAAAPVRPFSTSPVTTDMPDNEKMNKARLKAIQLQMDINNANRNKR
jgi:hypothetical protein